MFSFSYIMSEAEFLCKPFCRMLRWPWCKDSLHVLLFEETYKFCFRNYKEAENSKQMLLHFLSALHSVYVWNRSEAFISLLWLKCPVYLTGRVVLVGEDHYQPSYEVRLLPPQHSYHKAPPSPLLLNLTQNRNVEKGGSMGWKRIVSKWEYVP